MATSSSKKRSKSAVGFAPSSSELVKKSVSIKDAEGRVVFEKRNVVLPRGWSDIAQNVVVSLYFNKRKYAETGVESSILDVISRITSEIEKFAVAKKYFKKPEAKAFASRLSSHLFNQEGAFNSPVWFNLGVQEAPQCSACFIQSVDDDLDSIYDLLKNEARLFKFGSGTGSNFSRIRSRFESLETGGTASGLIRFLEIFDRSAAAIKSGGTTRRSAKMVCVDLDHPEILDFVRWKRGEEKKVRALAAFGFSSGLDGEAYRTVSGQNSNNSVRVSNSFLKAVEKNQDWKLRARKTGKTISTLPARELWKEIAESAWECADPGVQFSSTIDSWHTCKASGKIEASNPCSEYLFLNNTACNLASLNLLKFLKEDLSFGVENFLNAATDFFTAQEILVDLSTYPTPEISHLTRAFRPLGLGFANLGGLLMSMGIPYDSEHAREIASCLTSLLSAQAYLTSARLARKMGAFSEFQKNRTSMLKVLKMHEASAKKINVNQWKLLKEKSLMIWREAIELGSRTGFRNAQATVIAPTGTIGLVMDCDTLGIEPDFSLVKMKSLSGGGSFKLVNRAVTRALMTLNYSANERIEIEAYILKTGGVSGAPHLKREHYSVFHSAMGDPNDASQVISVEGHLLMMAAVQPFLSGAISKTVNVPRSTTAKEIESLYLRAWKLGLKAVAIYRDGSKEVQPLEVCSPSGDCG